MVHSIVLKFEKIWLSITLIIIRKPKVWRMDGRTDRHEDPYIPPDSRRAGYKNVYLNVTEQKFLYNIYS